MDVLLANRKFLKSWAQKIFEEEVKRRCSYDKLVGGQVEKLLILDSVKAIFKYYEEIHGMDWKSMMRETSPIFLSPAILNKNWISRVRKNVLKTPFNFL